VKDALESHSIKYEQQKMFNWLGLKKMDFYLPDYGISIECQGGQHFRRVEWFGGEEGFLYQKKCDKLKHKLCKEHNIRVLYFTHENYDSFLGERTIKTAVELIRYIKEDRKKEYNPTTPENEE
jgi:hypothetical protein